MRYSEKEIEEAKNRSIAEFFEKMGCKVDYIGKSEAHIRGYGGLYVHTANDADYNKYVIFSQQKNGKPLGGRDLVSCICNLFDKSYPEALKMALDGKSPSRREYDYSRSRPYKEKSVKPADVGFKLPQQADDNQKLFSYLCKRGISADLIQQFIDSKLLYQDKQGNAVFLHIKDDKPCGAEKHGTGSKNYFVGNAKFADFDPQTRYILKVQPYVAESLSQLVESLVPGNEDQRNRPLHFAGYVYENEANIVCNKGDYSFLKKITDDLKDCPSAELERLNERVHNKLKNFKGKANGTVYSSYFEYKVGEPSKAFVFESAIDLMSFMQLHPELHDLSFVSMGGLNQSVVKDLLTKYSSVVICTDNPFVDKASAEFMKQFIGDERIKNGTKGLREHTGEGIKDWNDLLMLECKKKQTIQSIPQIAQESIQAAQRTMEQAKAIQEQEREEIYDPIPLEPTQWKR